MTLTIRHDWCTEEIQTLLELPLMELLWRAQTAVSYTHLTLPTTSMV
mgnify:CR=1 FL=1